MRTTSLTAHRRPLGRGEIGQRLARRRGRLDAGSRRSDPSAARPCTVSCGSPSSRPSPSSTKVATAVPLKAMRWRAFSAGPPTAASRVAVEAEPAGRHLAR